MKEYKNDYYDGERPLFQAKDANIINTTFGTGESPLKESRNINLDGSIFTWKYPLWYSKHVKVTNTIFETMSRSGIWYTDDISIKDSTLQAPKLFRRCNDVDLQNVHFADAEETLWTCKNIKLDNVQAHGDYFGMNSENIRIDNSSFVGNYIFDGAKNIEVHNSTFVSKDAFWNCENVTIYDSVINGEYLAWNTKNIRFVNCTIESDQRLCYIDDLKMENCKLLRTDLAFEYCSNIDAEINSDIMSVKNPINGKIHARSIGQIIFDDDDIDSTKTEITLADEKEKSI